MGRTPSSAGRGAGFDPRPCGGAQTLSVTIMTEKSNRARAIGMVIGIVVLVLALLWKRLLR
jgi:hypothetical protein